MCNLLHDDNYIGGEEDMKKCKDINIVCEIPSLG